MVAAPASGVTALRVAGQPVVRDRLPRRGVGGELADARPPARVAVEGAHADADRVRVSRVVGVDLRSAVAAEPLLAARCRGPYAQPLGARGDAERALDGMRARRYGGARAALADRA